MSDLPVASDFVFGEVVGLHRIGIYDLNHVVAWRSADTQYAVFDEDIVCRQERSVFKRLEGKRLASSHVGDPAGKRRRKRWRLIGRTTVSGGTNSSEETPRAGCDAEEGWVARLRKWPVL